MRYSNNSKHELHIIEPFENMKDLIGQQVKKHPDAIAYRFTQNKKDCTRTFREFQEDVNSLGTAFSAILGLHGAHICMVGENCYQWIVTYLTVLGSDNVYIPADKDLPFNELMNVIEHSDASVVVTTSSFEKKFREHAGEMPQIKHFVVYNTKAPFAVSQDDQKAAFAGSENSPKANSAGPENSLNASSAVLDDAGKSVPAGSENSPKAASAGPEDDRFISAEQLMEEGRKLLKEGNDSYTSIVPEDEALGEIVYTSGTTGKAKGVMLSRHNLRSSVYFGMQVSNVMPVSLSILPYNHTYEAVCDILVCIHYGATLCINENLRTVADNFKKYNPDIVMLVPLFVENFYKKIWKELEKQGKAESVRKLMRLSNGLRKLGLDLRKKLFGKIRAIFGTNIKKIVCGGAPIRSDIASFFDGIGIDLCNGYGITECSPLVSANMDNYNDYRSVGCLLPCIEVDIRQPNAEGEGLIWVKGDIVMMGYYKNPEATAAVKTEDGWFNTGDYGKICDDKLFITGREKNLIVLKNGKNVFPEEIESYLGVIQEIQEIVVYSLKDEDGSEVSLCAEIFPESAFAKGKSTQEMTDHFLEKIEAINDGLPGYKQVHTVKVRDTEFPKTPSRKIKRQGLGQ